MHIQRDEVEDKDKAVYFKAKVLLVHLLLAKALGMTPLKTKQNRTKHNQTRKIELIFLFEFSVTTSRKEELIRL